jgi:hypothetical protein
MELMTHEHERTFIPAELASNRRRSPRLGGEFGLTFSGVDEGQMIMGDGHILDLSHEGIGVRGDRSLKPGMELALFIELPDSEDHLCIPEARVSWVRGRRFGVALRELKPGDQNRLRYFLWTHQQQKPV